MSCGVLSAEGNTDLLSIWLVAELTASLRMPFSCCRREIWEFWFSSCSLACWNYVTGRRRSVSGVKADVEKHPQYFLVVKCHFLNLSVRMWDWNWYTWVTKETHFYLHSLELLSLGLEAAQLLLQGCTLLPQHRLHPACLLLFNMKFLQQQHRTTLKHSDPALKFFVFFKHHSLNKYTDVILYIL